jgi:DNA-binding transcriptional LysR family regulator
MDLDKLKIFYSVVKEGSLQGAGLTLNLSVSAINRHILSLERDLNICLFHRTQTGLRVNSLGEVLFDTAREMMSRLQLTRALLTEQQETHAGPIMCVAPRALGEGLLMPHLLARIEKYPQLALTCLWEDEASFHLNEDQDIPCVYISHNHKPLATGFMQEKLMTTRLKAVGSPVYLEKQGRPHCPSDLAHHRLIGTLKGPSTHGALGEHLNDLLTWCASKSRPKALTVSDALGAAQAVEHHLGLALLPDYLVTDQMEEVLSQEVIVPWGKPCDVFAYYREEYRSFGRIHLLKALIKEVVQEQRISGSIAQIRGLEQARYVCGVGALEPKILSFRT